MQFVVGSSVSGALLFTEKCRKNPQTMLLSVISEMLMVDLSFPFGDAQKSAVSWPPESLTVPISSSLSCFAVIAYMQFCIMKMILHVYVPLTTSLQKSAVLLQFLLYMALFFCLVLLQGCSFASSETKCRSCSDQQGAN